MRTQAPDFWTDAKAAEKVMKHVRELKGWIEGCEEVGRAVDDLYVLLNLPKKVRLQRKKWMLIMLKRYAL